MSDSTPSSFSRARIRSASSLLSLVSTHRLSSLARLPHSCRLRFSRSRRRCHPRRWIRLRHLLPRTPAVSHPHLRLYRSSSSSSLPRRSHPCWPQLLSRLTTPPPPRLPQLRRRHLRLLSSRIRLTRTVPAVFRRSTRSTLHRRPLPRRQAWPNSNRFTSLNRGRHLRQARSQ